MNVELHIIKIGFHRFVASDLPFFDHPQVLLMSMIVWVRSELGWDLSMLIWFFYSESEMRKMPMTACVVLMLLRPTLAVGWSNNVKDLIPVLVFIRDRIEISPNTRYWYRINLWYNPNLSKSWYCIERSNPNTGIGACSNPIPNKYMLWVLDWDSNTIPIPAKTNLIRYPGIGLLGQSNPTFFDTWYWQINPIQYIGRYHIRSDRFHCWLKSEPVVVIFVSLH
jgi:hypothetical protein